MIPDEIVEKGAKAMWDAMCWKATWEEAPERDKRNWRDDTRAALEAVVPDLTAAARAEGWDAAADYLENVETMTDEETTGNEHAAWLLRSRSSLKPKATGEG